MINAWQLGNAKTGRHRLELYELAADTRAVLRAVFATPGDHFPRTEVRILPGPETHAAFDGDSYIEQSIATWNSQDLVLLDPFAMWRQPQHQERRNLYRGIVEQLLRCGEESPLLLLFCSSGPGARRSEWRRVT